MDVSLSYRQIFTSKLWHERESSVKMVVENVVEFSF